MTVTLNSLPNILRSVSGFNSAVTSVIVSVFFAISIYGNTVINGNPYPSAVLSLIALFGPLISGWQFMNVAAVLGTIAAKLGNDEDNTFKPVTTQEEIDVETQVFGSKTVLLRSIAGFICVHGLCFVSILFSYILHKNILIGKGYPPDTLVATIVVGPIITSWAFMGANKTLNQVFGIDSVTNRFRKAMGRLFNG